MALILSLETSTSVCSASLHESGKLVATSEVHLAQSTASKLALLIDDVKKIGGIEFNQLKAIATASGPGSYTGLRIGTSTAKGLCFALGIPLLAVNTLDLLAAQVSKFNIEKAQLCPMIDARRMEVYCKLLDAELNTIQPTEAKIIDAASFSEFLHNSTILFFGDGALKCAGVLKNKNAVFIEDIHPTASQLGLLAYKKYIHNQFENLERFEPFYLKDFVAKKPNIAL